MRFLFFILFFGAVFYIAKCDTDRMVGKTTYAKDQDGITVVIPQDLSYLVGETVIIKKVTNHNVTSSWELCDICSPQKLGQFLGEPSIGWTTWYKLVKIEEVK